MKTAQKIVNNLINDDVFSIKGQTRLMIFGDNEFMSKYTFYIHNPSVSFSQFDVLHLLIC